jgi:molybdopterin-containing oxidoreductase family iron-sulfur binding subunit
MTLSPDATIRDLRAEHWAKLAADASTGVSRRKFLSAMGASLGLAGVTACSRAPKEKIVPYAREPPEVRPGVPSFYATSMTIDGYAMGLLVESHEGRPTKVEGLPAHPDSLGATGPFEQAHVLTVYEPGRARSIRHRDVPATWPQFTQAFAQAHLDRRGDGLRFLLLPTTSPSLVDLLARLSARLPLARVHFYSPLSRQSVWEGARLAYGRVLEPHFDLRPAQIVLALGGDPLTSGPGFVPRARAFAGGRRLEGPLLGMNRLYVVETALSSTGAIADHRLSLRERDLPGFVAALAREVLRRAPGGSAALDGAAAAAASKAEHPARWVAALAADLVAHPGASAILVGDRLPPGVHALAAAMNEALGNVGRTVRWIESPVFEAGAASHDLTALAADLHAGRVETLVVLDGNPVSTAFADLDFAGAMRAAGTTVFLGAYDNETARASTWFVPMAHELESWGDARASDGTISFVQPLIARLAEGRTAGEVLAVFAGEPYAGSRDLLERTWRQRWGEPAAANAGSAFEARLHAALAAGVVEGTSSPAIDAALRPEGIAEALRAASQAPGSDPAATGKDALEIRFTADPRVHDGRFANNAWLLELPDPVTSLTWDNAAILSPRTAARLGVESEDQLEVRVGEQAISIPVLVEPDHADGSISLALGYGRTGGETVAAGAGVDVYPLRTSSAPYVAAGTARRVDGKIRLARGQLETDLHGRDDEVLLHRSLSEIRADPAFAEGKTDPPRALYGLAGDSPRQWGMTVDLNACVGCNACVVACQAENNVPVVGKPDVLKGRRMHWLRIDRYRLTEAGGTALAPQPMLCQHCAKAPCEYVCPVNATTHSADGLNQMVYNRCVGTRFCSNNCPYKVRRFNFFDYNQDLTPLEQLVKNPDVTVRERGVMEKCTYCVQRIREHEIRSEVQGTPIADGAIKTACEQACPTGAFVFGNLADSNSRVARTAAGPRTFAVLHDLGTLPHTRYLARISNPNPELT